MLTTNCHIKHNFNTDISDNQRTSYCLLEHDLASCDRTFWTSIASIPSVNSQAREAYSCASQLAHLWQ